MLMRPPNGDHAARPVSSKRTMRMFGASFGGVGRVYGAQSGLESRTSSLMTPLNGFVTDLSCMRGRRREYFIIDADAHGTLVRQSARSASTGSIRSARRAGRYDASNAMPATPTEIAMNVAGSADEMPKIRPDSA